VKRYRQYSADVRSGRILACEALSLAVERFERDRARSKNASCRWIFNEERADDAIAFIERLVQFEEPFSGVPIRLEPWECFFIGQLYGWREKKTDRRRFRKALLFMARKQGKTILAAAINLYEILTKDGIQAFTLATKQAVANVSYTYMREFMKADDSLADKIKVTLSPKSFFVYDNASTYTPLSSDCKLDGFNPSFCHIDELSSHTDGGRAYRTLTSGMGTRSEPLTLITSTASDILENPLIQEYEYGKRVLEGSSEDDAYLVLIYELDKGDKWDDLSMMQKACPNLGVSVALDYYLEELKSARLIPGRETEYKTKYCNLFISSDQTWIPDKTWQRSRNNARRYAATFADLARLPSFCGLDIATIFDYYAFTRYYYSAEADRYLARHRFYIPEAQVETKVYQESTSIRDWISRGLIVATPGESIDFDYVYRDVDEYLKTSNVQGMLYDPAKSKGLKERYDSTDLLIEFRQVAANMSPAAKAWEKAIVDGLIVDDNPVMRWMLSNTVNKSHPDSGSYYITKNPTSKNRRRIDGVITSIMAYWGLSNYVIEQNRPKAPPVDMSKIRY
jgi:phage terminase large subunit-like protein